MECTFVNFSKRWESGFADNLFEEHVSFQLNLPSLAGMYGKHVQEKAEALLKAGMYDRTGCDIHAIGCYKTLVASAVKSEVIGTLQKQSDQ